MLEVGIDEMTLVLQATDDVKAQIDPLDWANVAENIIYRFTKKAGFATIFGERNPELRSPQGYTVAYSYGQHGFYLAVAYHEYQLRMGVAVKFSAQALDYYCEASKLKVYEFLQAIEDDFYDIRLSRVDLTADFIDEDADVTKIYQNLMDGGIGIFRERIEKGTGKKSLRRQEMQFQGFLKGSEVPTIYIGSPKSKARLRVYDKKREQIERKGTKLSNAKTCDDWTRFEGVFRDEFAHQITAELMEIKSDDEYANLIASVIVQKFRIMYINSGVIDCATEYTQLLLDSINNANFLLRSPTSRNYDIAKSLRYLCSGSGVVSTLFKIRAIWGTDALLEVLAFLEEYVECWIPNADCRYWLTRNSADYQNNYPVFDFYFRDNVSLLLAGLDYAVDESFNGLE